MDEAGGTRVRLAGMMALLYAVQGAWYPLLAVHLQDLGIGGRGRGWIFASLAISAMVTPFAAGQIADRFLASQKLLSILYAAGTGLFILLACGVTTQFRALFGIFLLYWLIVAPGYGLANALCFRNLPRPAEQFGGVRLWGTVGWLGVGWLVTGVLKWSGTNHVGQGAYAAFWIATILSAIFAIYCLTLPNTPPLRRHRPAGEGSRWEGLELLRKPSVAVFLATAFVVSLTTPFVYQTVPNYMESLGLPRAWLSTAMTLGQILEIAALGALPWILRRFGSRWTLAIGVAGWLVYYTVLAARPSLAVVLAVLPINGIGIACFIVAGQMFLNGEAPPHRRASAQGLHFTVTSGVGSFLGNLLAGETVTRLGGIGPGVFLAPALLCAMSLAILLVWFRPRSAEPDSALQPLVGRVQRAPITSKT
jgi:MFS family permease